MKRLLFWLCGLWLLAAPLFAQEQETEISLFDADGEAVAYIARDDDLNIYLWKGEPVAYLKKDTDGVHIYGFNGDHLGWIEKGVVINHKGRVVGFIKGAISKFTKFERFKGMRRMTPMKAMEKMAPMQPMQKAEFSDCPLKAFLMQGAADY